MQLVAGSLIQDLIDVVARVSLLSTASGVTINFSGDTIGGTYPASVMGIMDSGECQCYSLCNEQSFCATNSSDPFLCSGISFGGNSSGMFLQWQVCRSAATVAAKVTVGLFLTGIWTCLFE